MTTDIALEVERLRAYVETANLIGRYQSFHSASRQAETVELFAKETPGGKLVFNGDIYEGFEGVKNHYLVLMAAMEQDLTGKLYLHEVVSPIIEVAGDAQTVKAQFSSIGCETGVKADGTKLSAWSFAKYRFDLIKENGRWVIYNLDLHDTFLTPFDGPGWGEIGHIAPHEMFANEGSKELTDWDPPIDGKAKTPYRTLNNESADCDIHDLFPAPPQPYASWDPINDPWVVERAE